ncbi:MAG: glycosyltransferase family 4 protein [Firmicutes bacterium]|nr:glycosyltransferase family 4 protein [Bacillota bacterium]
MDIAYVCTEKLPVPAARGGAIQTYIEAVAPRIAREHRVTVFGIADPDLPSLEDDGRLRYVRLLASDRKTYYKGVRQELSRGRFDLVQVFNRPKYVPMLRQAAMTSRFVLSVHNDMFAPEKLSPAEALECIDAVEAIVAISRFIAGKIASLYPSAAPKLRTIYSGVDWDRFAPNEAPAPRDQLGLGDRPVVLYVGRLVDKKGAHILLQAMPAILARRPDAVLVVVGSKRYGRNETDKYVRSLLAYAWEHLPPGSVRFAGFVPPQRVHAYFQTADVFVCPSQWEEPLSRTVYEAMAAGVPIVTSSRGGLPEVVRTGENGIVVDDFADPAAYAAAVADLLTDPHRARRMGQRGRELARQLFAWDRVARDLLALYAAAAS